MLETVVSPAGGPPEGPSPTGPLPDELVGEPRRPHDKQSRSKLVSAFVEFFGSDWTGPAPQRASRCVAFFAHSTALPSALSWPSARTRPGSARSSRYASPRLTALFPLRWAPLSPSLPSLSSAGLPPLALRSAPALLPGPLLLRRPQVHHQHGRGPPAADAAEGAWPPGSQQVDQAAPLHRPVCATALLVRHCAQGLAARTAVWRPHLPSANSRKA